MLFAIWFMGGTSTEAVRAAHRAEHLRFVIDNRDALVFGGACLDEAGVAMVGMLMVIDVLDRTAAEAFVAAEPYTRAGAFAQITIAPFAARSPEPCAGYFEQELQAELAKLGTR